MNIIKLKPENTEHFKLTVDQFEKQTHKNFPFFQRQGNEIRHYATCPACNNPVMIINLYVNKRLDENSNKMPLHARHIGKNIQGIANYDQDNYDDCPFKNPTSFSSNEKRDNQNKKNEILTIIKEYPEVLLNSIRQFTKINFSEEKFDNMLSNFISMEGYYYRYINKFNLPYSFFNMQSSINIAFQGILKFGSDNLKNTINRKSKLFAVKNGVIVKKDGVDGFAKLNAYFANHRIYQERETIEYILAEQINSNPEAIIYVEELEIDLDKFLNTINKYRRLRRIVNNRIQY